MGFLGKPHAVCIPHSPLGHINPMLKLANLLHFKGFHITFVNTEYNHKRLLKSRGPDALNGFPSFRFETIPDGFPEPEIETTQDIPSLCDSTSKNCLPHFRNLLHKLNNAPHAPPVTCIVSDGAMSFTLDAAQELGIPEVLFWTTSACGFMCYVQYQQLIQKGLTPLKVSECQSAQKASAIILNTFDCLEHDVLKAFPSILPPVYSIGPLNLLLMDVTDKELSKIGSNLWREEPECLEWLDTKEPNSVAYANFGSITVMTNDQLVKFAWGLANTNKIFLWVIRPDLVVGENDRCINAKLVVSPN
ncbi:hypothetical protein RJT34_12051 [Clitoria ternatea]|uniref:7-deoxyloganetin glucosyltransferase-like n=1 Tax=Clitoria ternatea TaxID=43366 RepID=A0AAN9PIZ5_CLITE